MKIVAPQFSCALGDLKANVRKVREFSSRANEFGAAESGLTAARIVPNPPARLKLSDQTMPLQFKIRMRRAAR